VIFQEELSPHKYTPMLGVPIRSKWQFFRRFFCGEKDYHKTAI